MESTNYHDATREALREQVNRSELVERIARTVTEDGIREVLSGLYLGRWSTPSEALHGVLRPCFCVIAQGSKEIHLGGHRYRYDPYHYLLATAGLPYVGQILEESKERPYLGLVLDLDSTLVSSVIVEGGHASPRNAADVRAIDVSPLDGGLLGAVVRLVRLLDSPSEAPVLGPLITKEILYRLLMGEQGARLRHIAVLGGQTHRIARAIRRLQEDFTRPLRVEEIAGELGMSVSGFHHHFKVVTGMSPLQFQKRLRLQQARRLMLGDNLDAATAGYRVGYDNASHFSREYKRLFGEPPMRDVERLREAARENAS